MTADARAESALKQILRHANRRRPKEKPLTRPEQLTSVDIAVAKSAARRLRGATHAD